MRNRSVVLVVFAFAWLTAATAQSAKPPTPPRIDPGTSLSAARTAIQKTSGTDALPLWLKAYAAAMTPVEAMTLCREFVPKARNSEKTELSKFAASLALVSGRLEDAAFFLAYPGNSAPDMLIDAVRCNLALGKAKTARTLLSKMPPETPQALADALALASAWTALIEGTPEQALAIVAPLVKAGAASPGRREALFLAWLCHSASPAEKGGTAPVLAALEAEFPHSTEYLLAKGNVRPQPSAWLLEGIYPFPSAVSVQERSVTARPQGDTSKDAKSSGTARLQVGWFSRRENAQSLSSVLKGKGFSASLDEQAASDGSARWAVIVEASGDWTKTQAQLKDLGYESYLLP